VVELLEWDWREKEQASQPVRKERRRLVAGYALVEDSPQWQPYALGVEGFAMKEEGSRWISREPSQELQGKKERDEQRLQRTTRLRTKKEERTNKSSLG